ncbi:MAG: hypothetical protein MZW92_42635 [Comamonadaceae bacterium]|nr:hypothetical protein [Comamonadaceae bacterium]
MVQPALDVVRRQSAFEEAVGGLDESNALFEARRCMSCGNGFGLRQLLRRRPRQCRALQGSARASASGVQLRLRAKARGICGAESVPSRHHATLRAVSITCAMRPRTCSAARRTVLMPWTSPRPSRRSGVPTAGLIEDSPMAERQEVVVTDIRMSFWSMVVFMVKWALASIPALFILVVIFYVAAMLLHTVPRMHA